MKDFILTALSTLRAIIAKMVRKGAVRICSGAYMTNCEKWLVEPVELPTKSVKEEEKAKEKDIQMVVFTSELRESNSSVVMRITEEQKRIIEILYDYDFLAGDIEVNFKDDTFIVDATKE